MRNKTAFKKAHDALENRDLPKVAHYLRMVYLKDVQAQTYLWMAINQFDTHNDVFEHFIRTQKATGIERAMHLVSSLGDEFWISQEYDKNLYKYNNELSAYVKIKPIDLQHIINEYEQVV